VCEVNFPTTFWEPLWVPKRRREAYLAHRAKPLKSKISTHSTVSLKSKIICHLRLSPRLKRILPSSGLLRGVRYFYIDVSGPTVSPETSV
jgi:hypothetical protein